MSVPGQPSPAKPVIGMFMKDRSLFPPLFDTLKARYGPSDMLSPWLSFDFTRYYEKEMGGPLFRRMVVFRDLMEQSDLASVKRFTNDLEKRYETGEGRRVNMDPGYLLRERFVLATGKNFTHRIYIGDGIYADLTLIYTKGAFQTLPWTYPDYADARMLKFLTQVRDRYILEMKKKTDLI